jgi:light-regulated signal transduction histidine kinase (bacteriophytochrome)
LVVCHHRQPHLPSEGQRAAAISLTDSFAARLGSAQHADTEKARHADRDRLARLLSQAPGSETLAQAIIEGEVTIANLFDSTGAALIGGGTIWLSGRTPGRDDVQKLAGWLQGQNDASTLIRNRQNAARLPALGATRLMASGVLAVFLSVERSDMLLWFRPEDRRK